MSKKTRSAANQQLEEIDRTMYNTFCNAANPLSQLHSQAMNQQKLAFQAGEHQSLERLYDWILHRQEEGPRVTATDIVTYIQNELDYGGEESSPRFAFQVSSCPFGPAASNGTFDYQAKNSIFSSALASPVCQSLQNYHLDEGGYHPYNVMNSGQEAKNEETYSLNQNRDVNSFRSNDACMDMSADHPVS